MSGKPRKAVVSKNLPTGGTVAVLNDGGKDARVVRLFHIWRDLTPVERASELLNEAIGLLPTMLFEGVLVAGAGFVGVVLPQATRNRFPDRDEFENVLTEARRAAAAIRDALPDNRPVVCIGIDVLATCCRSPNRRHVGQFAAIIFSDETEATLVAKAYPTTEEESYLRITSDGTPRIIGTLFGRGAVLVCHDINAYSPRGTATTSHDYRQDWRDNLHREVQTGHPAFALNLAHYLGTARTFRQAYNAWALEVGIPLIGVGGLDSHITDSWARELAAGVLSPSNYPVFDLWEIGG